MTTVWRIQCKDGRGPWKPGFSHKWVDVSRTCFPPTIMEDFGHDAVLKCPLGFHIGCAALSIYGLRSWFSLSELKRLEFFGYHLAEMDADEIIGTSPTQVLFIRRKRFNTDLRKHPATFVYADF